MSRFPHVQVLLGSLLSSTRQTKRRTEGNMSGTFLCNPVAYVQRHSPIPTALLLLFFACVCFSVIKNEPPLDRISFLMCLVFVQTLKNLDPKTFYDEQGKYLICIISGLHNPKISARAFGSQN